MNNKRIGVFASWVLVVLWMFCIFYFSSQAADQSDELSGGISAIIVEFLENTIPGYTIDIAEFDSVIRKAAHFSIYLILGSLVSNALKKSGIEGWRLVVLAFGICALYAISDEVHQIYVPGRSGQAMDVMIDSAGSVIGISGMVFIKYSRNPS